MHCAMKCYDIFRSLARCLRKKRCKFFFRSGAGCLPAGALCFGRARASRCLRSLARWRSVLGAAMPEARATRSRTSPTLPSLLGEIAQSQRSWSVLSAPSSEHEGALLTSLDSSPSARAFARWQDASWGSCAGCAAARSLPGEMPAGASQLAVWLRFRSLARWQPGPLS
jgi:hypothetical protein